MRLYIHLSFVFLGTILASFPQLVGCRKLDGYEFPVYLTEFCPRNQTEWKERSSAINCTDSNGYMCLPNKNLTELLEFCYIYPFIWIQEDLCLYLWKRASRVDSYRCSHFMYGCPNSSFPSFELFEYPTCTSIGKGCFLAEEACQRYNSTAIFQGSTANKRASDKNDYIWTVVILGLYIFLCLLFCIAFLWYLRKRIAIRNRQSNVDLIPLMRNRTHDGPKFITIDYPTEKANGDMNIETISNYEDDMTQKMNGIRGSGKGIENESLYEKAIFDQWQQDNYLFIPTKACKEVEKLADSENLIIVTGNSGSGKSAIIQHVALKYRKQGWIVKPLNDVNEILDTLKDKIENKTLLVISNPIGKESFDEISYRSWKKHEQSLQCCLKTVKLITSSRKLVLFDKRVTGILRDESKIINLEDNQWKLSHHEKRLIWNKHTCSMDLSEEEFATIFEIDTYFPLLCKLWSRNIQRPTHELRQFFKEPLKVFKDELEYFRKCDKEKYCVLVLLVLFNNKLCVRDDILESEISKNKFQHALKVCGLSLNTPLNEIRDNLELLNGFLVKKIGDSYQFYHDFVMEVTTLVFGIDNPEDTITYADTSFLRKRVKLQNNNEHSDPYTVYLSDRYVEKLGKRLFTDIFGEHLLDVVLNPCLRNEKVTKIFIDEIKFHPEKLSMLLTTRKYKTETHDHRTSENLYFSRLDILDVQGEISPLCALIVFCHTDISLYCFQTLKDRKVNFIDNLLFSAVCCNGSMDLYNMFRKDQVNEYLPETCINMVSMLNNFEILSELLQYGVDVNVKSDDKYILTPLMLAVGNGSEENNICRQTGPMKTRRDSTVQLLLDSGADVNLCMEDGLSPLLLACHYQFDSTVQLLLDNGANINSCMMNGLNALHVASENGHDKIVQLLLNNGIDTNSLMKNGSTPLYLACLKKHDSVVKLLLQNKANINLCMNDGTSNLHLACFNGFESTVELLLRHGADVNACMKYGGSPLHLACLKGHNNIVCLLLRYGAKINLCMERGISPLYIANINGHGSTVKLLLKNKADISSCEELSMQLCKRA